MQIQENLVLGIDLGIASCGWAIIDESRPGDRIVAMGVRTFDAPEDNEHTPTNQLRRQHRGMRRVIHRRAQRMDKVRQLFHAAGLLKNAGKDALKIKGLDPWRLRAEGVTRRLTDEEFAVALGHIAKHRGFRSNSKRKLGHNRPPADTEKKTKANGVENGKAGSEESRMKAALDQTSNRLQCYKTAGLMFFQDDAFQKQKRNRAGNFVAVIQRSDQEKEVQLLFEAQRRAGNTHLTRELEHQFIEDAFSQKGIPDSESKVGWCPFEKNERRASRFAPSFEKFRFLSRLTTLRVQTADKMDVPLTTDQLRTAMDDFGSKNGMSFHRLRTKLKLDDGIRFAGIPWEDEAEHDVVKRKASGKKKGASPQAAGGLDSGKGCMEGTKTLRDCLGEAPWNSLKNTPEKLDQIAFTLTFREDKDSIRKGLAELGIEQLVIDVLMQGVERGDFSNFKRAGHLSAKVCRAVIPHLLKGLTYDKAMQAAGYTHTAVEGPEAIGTLNGTIRNQIRWASENISNPVAKKALIEALKQTGAIVAEFGLPGHIHVELARDIGKSKEERDRLWRGIQTRTDFKKKLASQFAEDIGHEPRESGDDLLRYELWKEQHCRCLYCDQEIHPNQVVSSDNSLQADHILPWSRSGDNSFTNKTLCHVWCNQNKKERTPYEWIRGDQGEGPWENFVARVESIKEMKGFKKRNYLLTDAKKLDDRFRPRNLNDTRYGTRLLLDALARWYPDDVRVLARSQQDANRATEHWFETEAPPLGKVRVASRPGPLTDRLRRGWGVQDLKKRIEPDGLKRKADDRHHALDALIVAATTQAALARFTRAVQEAKKRGNRDFCDFDPPWKGFVEEVRAKFDRIFVSRAERRRARGEAHAATIRQIEERDGAAIVYERKSVDSLNEKDLERIKDPERNVKLIASLREWIAASKPKDRRPLSPKGDPVSKVRLRTSKNVDVLVQDGAADRGDMVRVDVFRKQNAHGKWEYFLVPIYPHQVADAQKWTNPPNRAIQKKKPEKEWPVVDGGFEYLFPLYQRSYAEMVTAKGEVFEGYLMEVNRNDGGITLFRHYSKLLETPKTGSRTLLSLKKYQVDRLGRRFEIPKETRTWHGAVCT